MSQSTEIILNQHSPKPPLPALSLSLASTTHLSPRRAHLRGLGFQSFLAFNLAYLTQHLSGLSAG